MENASLAPRDIHWLAGILEGEGTFGDRRRIRLKMTDRDVVERVAKLWKRPLVVEKLQPNRKQAYSTAIGSIDAIGWMMTLYSLLGTRRQTKIRQILADWKSTRQIVIRDGKCLRHPNAILKKYQHQSRCGECRSDN